VRAYLPRLRRHPLKLLIRAEGLRLQQHPMLTDPLAGDGQPCQRVHIPEPQGVVVGAGDDAATIGAEDDGADPVCVSLEGGADGLAGGCIPEPQGVVA